MSTTNNAIKKLYILKKHPELFKIEIAGYFTRSTSCFLHDNGYKTFGDLSHILSEKRLLIKKCGRINHALIVLFKKNNIQFKHCEIKRNCKKIKYIVYDEKKIREYYEKRRKENQSIQ